MENEEKNGKKPGKFGYYSVIALSLVIIGAVSFITVSRLSGKNIKNKNNQNISSGSYKNSSVTPSAESSKEPKKETESAAGNASSEPYTPPASSTAEEPKRSFTLPVEGAVIKPYSDSMLQYSKTYGDTRLHMGIDIKCAEGTKVLAATNGTVTDVQDDPTLGKTVSIDHGNGIIVKYCGLKTVTVSKGNAVQSGTQIGVSGTVPCECADEAHIHIEAYIDGKLSSPMEAIGLKEEN